MYRLMIVFILLISSHTQAQTWPDDFLNSLVMRATECCKICTTSKACGDSCISKSFNCSKPAGCACDAGDIPNDDSDDEKDEEKDPVAPGGNDKPKEEKVICPKAIARKGSGTFAKKKNFSCFKKAALAEDKGFIKEPVDASVLVGTTSSIGKIKCPKFIADKRIDLFATGKAFECFSKAKHAKTAGYVEG